MTKPVKVETGAEIICPAFIEMGNVIKVDTRTGDYVERKRQIVCRRGLNYGLPNHHQWTRSGATI